jgi:hypothetical protein
MKAIVTLGVSASGKSTWARRHLQERSARGERWILLEPDLIRVELIERDQGPGVDVAAELKAWDYDPAGASEARVLARWDALAAQAFADGVDGVVVGGTNLDGGAQKIARLAALGLPREQIAIQFFPIALPEAIERDRQRPFQVGEAVLASQFQKLDALLARADSEPALAPSPRAAPKM